MAGVNVAGGRPTIQQTLQTMNQSTGQLLSFIQNKKVLEEQTREFNIGKNLQVFENMATQAGGYYPLAKLMGEQGMADFFKAGGMDSLQATQMASALGKIQETPEQFTMQTFKDVLELPFEDPRRQDFFNRFGGEKGTPSPAIEGLQDVGQQALGVAGDIFGAVGGQEGIDAAIPEDKNGDNGEAARLAAEEAARLKAEQEAKLAEETQDKISTLRTGYDELLKKIETSRDLIFSTDLRKRADEIKEEIEALGGSVVPIEGPLTEVEKKQELKRILKEGIRTTPRAQGVNKGRKSPFVLGGQVSSGESSYTDKFTRESLGGIFPTGFQDQETPDALNGGIPTTQAEFNKLQSTTRRDKANLALATSMRSAGIATEEQNKLLNLMDGTYTPSVIEGAEILKNYEERLISYNAEAKRGNVPPVPAGVRRSNEALYIVSKAFVDEIPIEEVPTEALRIAVKKMLDNANAPEVRDKLADDIDLIIQVSKNPALATYFMSEVESNRLENKRLSQADARLIANKDITTSNLVLGLLNYAIASAGKSQEGSAVEALAWQFGVSEYKRIQAMAGVTLRDQNTFIEE